MVIINPYEDPHTIANTVSENTDTEFSEDELAAMWQTTSAYHEQRWLASQGKEPTNHQRQRWAETAEHFLAYPRYWYVADCGDCEWSSGGWLTQDTAHALLNDHVKLHHTAAKSTNR